MTINADIQKLSPGKLIDLYELRLDDVGGERLRFHAYTESGEGEENFVGDSEIIALGGASNETKDRPLG